MSKAKTVVPLLYPAPSWQAPRSRVVALWHGCVDSDRQSIEANGVDVSFGKVNTDFGRGFYTTTLKRQAAQWAWRRHFDLGRSSPPVVLRFRVQRWSLAKLDVLGFVLGDFDNEDFWSLVQHCRRSNPGAHPVSDHDGPHRGWYDLVLGPVAAMWRQRVAMVGADQHSFHTDRATKLLTSCINSGDPRQYRVMKVR